MVHNYFVVVSQFLICASQSRINRKNFVVLVCGPVTRVMTCNGPQVMAPPALYNVVPPTS